MSHIDDLIRQHCPDGVEFRPLREVARIKNGKDYRSFGEGPVPVYGSGGVMARIDAAAHGGPSVLIPRKGSLSKIYYVDEPFWTGDTIFYTEIDESLVVPKFLFHVLVRMRLENLNQAGGVPSLTQTMLNPLRVPVPPMEVQREIVRVLDLFQSLEAELEAELEARRRQYAHYRDSLLTFNEQGGVRWMALGDIGSLFGGLTGKAKADFQAGNARYVSYMNVFGNIATNVEPDDMVKIEEGERQRRLQRGDILFTGSSETPIEVGMSSVLTAEPPDTLYLNSFCIGFRGNDPDLLDPEFTKHLFRAATMRHQIVRTANGVTRFNVSKGRLAKVKVPVPSRDQQAWIARVLDNFEALVNDLSVGLPAELAARRQQYEYYRDRLLTFEEAV